MREKSIGKDPSKHGFGFGSLQEVTNRRDPLKRVAWIQFGFAGERRRKSGWLVFLVGVLNSCFADKTEVTLDGPRWRPVCPG